MNSSTSLVQIDEGKFVKFLESSDFQKASANLSRLMFRLKNAIQNQELYETHQILRTIHFRFINSSDKVPILKDLLYNATCYFISNKEYTSAQDIGALFLEASAKFLQDRREQCEQARLNLENPSLLYHVNHKTDDLDITQKLASIASELPDTEIGRNRFIANVIKTLHSNVVNRGLLMQVLIASGLLKPKQELDSIDDLD